MLIDGRIETTNFRDATAEDRECTTRLGRQRILADAGKATLDLLRSQKDGLANGWQVNNHEHSLQ
jgi:hypothetical protein